MQTYFKITIVVFAVAITIIAASEQARKWKPLAEDGLHDPELPVLDALQNPEEALKQLPYDYVGNQVMWNEALADGVIEPRTNLYPGTKIRVLDMDIVMGDTADAALVMFPHREHSEWLDCSNCHNEIFIDKTGANNISMMAILNGEYCGVCHGAVSFPLVECNRCHSIPRSSFEGKLGTQESGNRNSVDAN